MDTINVTVRTNATEDGCRRTTSAPSEAGLRPEPDLEQLECAEQIDSFGEVDCGGYGRILVLVISEERQAFFVFEFDILNL